MAKISIIYLKISISKINLQIPKSSEFGTFGGQKNDLKHGNVDFTTVLMYGKGVCFYFNFNMDL